MTTIDELDRQRNQVTTAIRRITGDADWEAYGGQIWPKFYSPVEPCESCGTIVVAADDPFDYNGWEASPVQVWELGEFPPAASTRFVLASHARLHTPELCKAAR